MPPHECITLKRNATINDLKLEVERDFREICWELRSFMVESFGNLSVNNETMAFGLIEVGGKVVLEGWHGDIWINMIEQICESDMNNGIMDCTCGTIEDDGERMVSCDICEIWQHTRCVWIPNDEEIPQIFFMQKVWARNCLVSFIAIVIQL